MLICFCFKIERYICMSVEIFIMTASNDVCVKYCILLLNIFLLVSGIIIASLGIYVKRFYYSYESFVTDQYLYAPNFLIVLGGIIFMIAFIGCCGILTENSCLSLTIIGIILLSVGISVKAYYAGYELFLDGQYLSAANLLIAIGIIIFFIAFFGCCGAIKDSYCMMITFSTLLILVFILQLAAGIAGYALKNQTIDFLSSGLNNSMLLYNQTNGKEITELWDLMQPEFHCCGVHGPKDWAKNLPDVFVNDELPISCCERVSGAIGIFKCTLNAATLNFDGCLVGFGNFIKSHALTIGGVGIGFAVVQLLGIVFACHMSSQFKMNYDNM